MSVITNVEKWGNSHRPAFLDIIRIALGLYITYKGIYFIGHMQDLETTTSGFNNIFAGVFLAHYIVFVHVLGGPLIVVGIFTRFISLLQLPILIGAVFLINYPHGHLGIGQGQNMEFWISMLVLIGLMVMIVFGAGEYSIDAKRRRDIMPAHH